MLGFILETVLQQRIGTLEDLARNQVQILAQQSDQMERMAKSLEVMEKFQRDGELQISHVSKSRM